MRARRLIAYSVTDDGRREEGKLDDKEGVVATLAPRIRSRNVWKITKRDGTEKMILEDERR